MDGVNFASDDEQNDAYYDNVANNRRNYNRNRNRVLARVVVAVAGHRLNTRRQSQPMHNSTLTGSMRVEELLNGHEEIIQGMVSMKAETFRSLSNLLASRGLLKTTRNMNVNEQLFIFLAICARGETSRHISYLFQHSVETTSRWFYKVLQVICSLKDEFIRPADYTSIQNLIMENSEKYRPWFDGCVGAIDGTHIPCAPRRENADAWINRKGYHSQNVLAACSFDMLFTYILTGYEGSCHDARMLEEAIAFHGFPLPPPGKFYLVDSGYANKDCFLSPYRRETYHIPEFRRRRDGLGNRREVFNYTHSSLRNCIERTFGVWKARFKILKGVNNYPMDKQKMIPVACAVVHNFIRMVQVGDPILEQYVADSEPVRGNVDVNADYVFNDGIDGTGPSTGSHQHDPSREALNGMRDHIANEMWERYQVAPWYKQT
ncbi:hypothetical protein TIFTF001_016471 [Ficus carica]|uniref:DDE Tnp4 domain-containing protein n=1 Tax=Ficus carica TaxID=3494 RepID=A0AA88D677_FICCA|nr:hypothetical protein TIFTF001_016471 [Ficus carica]